MVESNNYEIPYSYKKYMSPEEQHAIVRSFKNFDKNKDGTVDRAEFKSLLKDMGRDDVTDD